MTVSRAGHQREVRATPSNTTLIRATPAVSD
jgi:hypothetical protein